MANYAGDIIICVLILLSISIIYGTTEVIKSYVSQADQIINSSTYYNWIVKLGLNLLGYGTILLPGYLIYKYVRSSKYLQRGGGTAYLARIVHCCFSEGGERGLLESPKYASTASHARAQRTLAQETLLLFYCFFGLQVSYLTWGYLQEKIMTQEYADPDGKKSHFQDSQFLVLVNRILAFCMSGLYLLIQRQPHHTTPMYKYSFCSLSNILSSWCQYEALKYVSFPTQVLAKASKIIPVMIMGKIISRTKYEYYEYVTAVFISVGMALFMLGSVDSKNNSITTFSGVLLLGSYMVLDSFTSNWQNAIFTEYSTTSVQMMCIVNMFSCMFTATSLFQQSSFAYSLEFMSKHPAFIIDCLLISICSASGQLYIFYTISKFGPVTFVIIMAIRQAIAILLSCVIYKHHITVFGIFGILIVFLAVFLRIYCNNRLRAIKQRRAEANSIKD